MARATCIYGHQDDTSPFHQLDRWEQLNVKMDTLAKSHWRMINQQQRPYFDLPTGHEWSIWHQGKRLVQWNEKIAQQLIHETSATSYWTKKHRIPNENQPAWQAIYQAYSSTTLYKKLWIPKWLTSWLPIGRKLKQWKIQLNETCPGCGEPERHRHHVIRCTKPETVAQWNAAVNRLDRWLELNHTQPDLQAGIIEGLRAWHGERQPTHPHSAWPGVDATFDEQANLGWNKFIDGFLSHYWISTQQSYLTYISKKTTGKRWTSRLITQLWEIAWDMWKHRMKIVDTPDSQALISLMTELDIKIQTRFTRFQEQPIQAMQRWFNQPPLILALETVDFKQQWIELVDSAWAHYQ
jgi:hypothetical protein